MIKNKINKKAQLGHAVTWLHKFFILVLVIGGVVAVMALHYFKQYDIRDVEASALARKILECVAPDGNVEEFTDEAVKGCFPFNEKEIYINLTLEDNNLAFGDDFLLTLCQAEEKKVKVKYYPSCLEEKYYVLENGKPEKIEIFLAIKKIEKNL